jgi:MFS family permease
MSNTKESRSRASSSQQLVEIELVRTNQSAAPVIEGSTTLYDNAGMRQHIPMPSSDPRDPLNLPTWRKATAIAVLCLFGAMASAAELILAALLPLFAFEYGGLDPNILCELTSLPPNVNGGVDVNPLPDLGTGPPLWKIYLIGSLPVLVIGLSNYLLVPLSIAIGRRPVILICGLLAWTAALWGGFSQSLDSHLAARSIQALGAGTVETLIPLIIQDMVFIHWRNRAIAAVFASQGVIIVTLGICSPWIVCATSWRMMYYITASCAGVAWIGVFFLAPETLWVRTSESMRKSFPGSRYGIKY